MTGSLVPRASLRHMFVEAATEKFAGSVRDFAKLRAHVIERGGQFRNDHAAIRSADPRVTSLLVRVAAQLDMYPDRTYSFPAKKLESFDLQVPGDDAAQFKLFISEVDSEAFPEGVAATIREDAESSWQAADHAELIELLNAAEANGGVAKADADRLLALTVDTLLTRPGPPIRRAVLNTVAEVSGEAASALALGADFNHVTIDVLAAGYPSIDAMTQDMRSLGFRMLPAIQGAPGTQLRQTATMAQTMDTPILEDDGATGIAQTERQFVEIIERSVATDDSGRPLQAEDGSTRIYKHFLAANAEKIFDAASTRARVS